MKPQVYRRLRPPHRCARRVFWSGFRDYWPYSQQSHQCCNSVWRIEYFNHKYVQITTSIVEKSQHVCEIHSFQEQTSKLTFRNIEIHCDYRLNDIPDVRMSEDLYPIRECKVTNPIPDQIVWGRYTWSSLWANRDLRFANPANKIRLFQSSCDNDF